jgi:hypothetical protein
MTLALILGGVAVVGGVAGLIWPQSLRYVYVGWMVLAFPIGWTVSQLLLLCMYYGVFTPVALIFRLIGRDALARGLRPEVATYWEPKPAAADVRGYFRQF